LACTPDLSDHDDRVGLRVRLEGRQTVDEVRPDERVAAEADACGLTQPLSGQLVHDLVGECSAARHYAHPAGPADVAVDDPLLAPACSDELWSVVAVQARLSFVQV